MLAVIYARLGAMSHLEAEYFPHEFAQLLIRGAFSSGNREKSLQVLGLHRLVDVDEQLVLAADVPVERREGDASGLCEVSDRHCVEPPLKEELRSQALDFALSLVSSV